MDDNKSLTVLEAANFISYLGPVVQLLLNVDKDLWNLSAYEDNN